MSNQPSGFKPLMQSRGGESDIGQDKYVESNSYRGLAIFRGLWVHRPYCMKDNQHVKHANAIEVWLHSPGKF